MLSTNAHPIIDRPAAKLPVLTRSGITVCSFQCTVRAMHTHAWLHAAGCRKIWHISCAPAWRRWRRPLTPPVQRHYRHSARIWTCCSRHAGGRQQRARPQQLQLRRNAISLLQAPHPNWTGHRSRSQHSPRLGTSGSRRRQQRQALQHGRGRHPLRRQHSPGVRSSSRRSLRLQLQMAGPSAAPSKHSDQKQAQARKYSRAPAARRMTAGSCVPSPRCAELVQE